MSEESACLSDQDRITYNPRPVTELLVSTKDIPSSSPALVTTATTTAAHYPQFILLGP